MLELLELLELPELLELLEAVGPDTVIYKLCVLCYMFVCYMFARVSVLNSSSVPNTVIYA